MQNVKTSIAVALAVLVMNAGGTLAGEPTAIVSDIVAPGSGIEPLQYLERGLTIDLGTEGRLVLGYLRSCVQEQITGGIVTIGQRRSSVKNGRTTSKQVECDGGKIMLTAEQAGKSGALVFRNPRRARPSDP